MDEASEAAGEPEEEQQEEQEPWIGLLPVDGRASRGGQESFADAVVNKVSPVRFGSGAEQFVVVSARGTDPEPCVVCAADEARAGSGRVRADHPGAQPEPRQ